MDDDAQTARMNVALLMVEAPVFVAMMAFDIWGDSTSLTDACVWVFVLGMAWQAHAVSAWGRENA